MTRFLLKIVNWGTQEGMSFQHSRRIRLINLFAGLAVLATFPYIFIFFQQKTILGPLSLFYFLSFLFTWLLNYWRKFGLARFWLYTMCHLYLFTTASSFGRHAGEQLILIPVLFGSVLVFEFREKLNLFLSVFFTLVTFLVLELTNYSLLNISLSPAEQLDYYYGNLVVTLFSSIGIAVFYFYLYGKQYAENQEVIATSKEIEQTINYFSTSLFGKNRVDEILWDVAKNCIGRLGFSDCVIYLLDKKEEILVQKAAYGPKNPNEFEIYKPINIPVGEGIVGYVAKTGEPLIVGDTSQDPRYITDDEVRLSEIAVPLLYNDEVIGVIDSEHPERNFFKEGHLNVLKTIASLCANKITKAVADLKQQVAEKIQLEARLEAEKIKTLDELKTKLYTDISHELKTPLTLIFGTIEQQLKFASDDNRQQWKNMHLYTERLLRLVNQMLDLNKIESGNYKLNKKVGDVFGFIRNIANSFINAAEQNELSLKYLIPEKPLYASFDHDALEKVFYNLFSNALKFGKAGTTVSFTACYLDRKLIVEITDQGPGIPRQDQDKIFKRFYQADTRNSSGMGIGLALTKELVEQHSGFITVSSTVNKGTIFTVSIPLEGVEDAPVISDTLKTKDRPKTLKITEEEEKDKPLLLVIEDDVEVSNFILKVIKDRYRVEKAVNGNEGFLAAEKAIPDLIISDVMMPEKDGIALCRELKNNEKTCHIPIILLTAKADQHSKMEGLKTGADDYLTKPFSMEELLIRINNLLQSRRKLQEKYGRFMLLKSEEIVITGVDEIFLKKVLEIVHRELSNADFTTDDFCEKAGLSRMQLHRKLTALTGLSATGFVRNIRLQHASELLKNESAPVSQVAYAVGFNSLSYFTKSFKEKFGVLPSEFASLEGQKS